jgi:hypothetical protein
MVERIYFKKSNKEQQQLARREDMNEIPSEIALTQV